MNKRYASGGLGSQNLSKRDRFARVIAVKSKALQGYRKLLVRNSSIRPSVSRNVEGLSNVGL